MQAARPRPRRPCFLFRGTGGGTTERARFEKSATFAVVPTSCCYFRRCCCCFSHFRKNTIYSYNMTLRMLQHAFLCEMCHMHYTMYNVHCTVYVLQHVHVLGMPLLLPPPPPQQLYCYGVLCVNWPQYPPAQNTHCTELRTQVSLQRRAFLPETAPLLFGGFSSYSSLHTSVLKCVLIVVHSTITVISSSTTEIVLVAHAQDASDSHGVNDRLSPLRLAGGHCCSQEVQL